MVKKLPKTGRANCCWRDANKRPETFLLKPSFSTTTWKEIAFWELRKTKALEFGGLGFRRAKDGWAYIFNLNYVLKITITKGKVFYLSITNEQVVEEIMKRYLTHLV